MFLQYEIVSLKRGSSKCFFIKILQTIDVASVKNQYSDRIMLKQLSSLQLRWRVGTMTCWHTG